MILGIDGSNLRRGGGITHLVSLLKNANPLAHGISRVIVWGGAATLGKVESREWLFKVHQRELDRGLASRIYWQRFVLSKVARSAGCSVLFVPGGSFAGTFNPVVTMSRNMLPFEATELLRYGLRPETVKLMLLRWIQSRSMRQAAGVIFLTEFARISVMRAVGPLKGRTSIIPHGVDRRFLMSPRVQAGVECYSEARPFRLIYVSIVDLYKHQWHVAMAAAKLREAGFPVELELVGPAYGPALVRLRRVLKVVDPGQKFIRYLGPVAYEKLPFCYERADLCVFASSCENMPNILLEAMASGLPVASSGRGPMPEILGEAGVYFDPENPDEIANALRKMICSVEERTRAALGSRERIMQFSWERCADETFAFLASIGGGVP